METLEKIQHQNFLTYLVAKLKDYAILVKVRLNLTVVFSSAMGYLLAVGADDFLLSLIFLSIAGFCVTSSANALNQIIEKDYDKLMKRTANRPLATGRMGITEALLVAGILGVGGILLLWYMFNDLAALIGAVSLLSYAFIYTPLKRIHPIAVFVGAIPGALPPMIGWVAATGVMSIEAYTLFAIQFLWQFPHFWAIAWLGADEYAKAGYKLQPVSETRSQKATIHIIVYILFLIIVTLTPVLFQMLSIYFTGVALLLGVFFLYYGINLFKKCDNKAALHLMLASVIYLPLLQILMVVDRWFLL
ncbi:MAG: heme o synthase [Chitinophagales bacterium]